MKRFLRRLQRLCCWCCFCPCHPVRMESSPSMTTWRQIHARLRKKMTIPDLVPEPVNKSGPKPVPVPEPERLPEPAPESASEKAAAPAPESGPEPVPAHVPESAPETVTSSEECVREWCSAESPRITDPKWCRPRAQVEMPVQIRAFHITRPVPLPRIWTVWVRKEGEPSSFSKDDIIVEDLEEEEEKV